MKYTFTNRQNKNNSTIPEAIEASNSFDPYVRIRRCNSIAQNEIEYVTTMDHLGQSCVFTK